MKKSITLSTLLCFLLIGTTTLKAQIPIPSNFKISQRSKLLFDKINEYRSKNGLDKVPLSTSLCWVAYLHNEDLLRYNADTADCFLSSWSDGPLWKGACINKKSKNIKYSRNKPKELTNYPAQGYELSYWQNTEPNIESVLTDWSSDKISNDILLNQGAWKNHEWNAIGISTIKNYVLVWFGTAVDPIHTIESTDIPYQDWFSSLNLNPTSPEEQVEETQNPKSIQPKKENQTEETPPQPEPKQADQNSTTQDDIQTNENGSFFLIIGTYSNLEEAKKLVNQYKADNNPKVGIINQKDKYRIYWGRYNDYDSAQRAKNQLPEKIKGAWILSSNNVQTP